MKLIFPSPEFDDAVAAVCHGEAPEPVMRALNELLRGDPRARDEYLMRVEVHARLASDPDLFPRVAGAGAVEETSGPAGVGQSEDAALATARPAFKIRLLPALALAACVVFAALGWAWFRWEGTRSGATSTAVAMLTHAVDARWRVGAEPIRVGSALGPGWFRLESGLVQVVFYSGVRMVLEGPAELQLVSSSEAVCSTGRLLAEVPPPARGFRLRTDQLNVVDLGTEFGVDATRGRTEVHVFKGSVEMTRPAAVARSLAEGEAALVQKSAPPQFMAANAAAFGPMFEFQKLSLASEANRYYQWRLASARLNQDPSLVVHLDLEDLGEAAWTLRNAVADNRAVPDATVVGCQRAQGRWREKQALEFQSVNDRVRLAVPGEFDALTLAAWVCIKGLDREINSLFMSDGFHPGTVHWSIRNDGVLGVTLFGNGPNKFQIMASPPVLTLDQFGMWIHLAVVLDGRSGQATHYVNGSPVSHHTLKLGPPFRIGSAELGNWNAQRGPNLAPFLIRNLSGSLDEFELFSRALSEEELLELYQSGKPDL